MTLTHFHMTEQKRDFTPYAMTQQLLGKTSSYLNSTKVELSYELVLQKVNVCTGVAQHLKTFHVIEIEIKEKLEFNWKFFILN